MSNARLTELARKWTETWMDFSPGISHLLLRVWRTQAKGRPVSGEQIDQIIADLGIDQDEANQFLRRVTERDSDDNIVGILGLSLKDYPHRFHVNGASLSTWCAFDALFLPAMLKQTATIESPSLQTKKMVKLTVSPERVENVSPAGAAVSIVTLSPDEVNTSSAKAVYSIFCHQMNFFASHEEAEQWAEGRDNIEILSVDEAYEFGKLVWSKVLAYDEE